VHADAAVRVTHTPRPVTEDLAFATDLVLSDWFAGLPQRAREAIVTKIIRVHVFGHVLLRAEAGTWNKDDAREMAQEVRKLLFGAPQAARPLALADRKLLDAIVREEPDAGVMKLLAQARRRFASPRTWMPRDVSRVLHPEAPLRFMSASALV
jgi:hypothetical protein